MQGAALPRHQRDGAAWFGEWLILPQIVLGASAALVTARQILAALQPDAARIATVFQDGLDLIHAEALSFALAQIMPRPEAQAEVKRLCREAVEQDKPLRDLVAARWPDLPAEGLFDPHLSLGHAPDDARGFAAAVRALPPISGD